MYTVEFENDSTTIVSIDETASHEDLIITIEEDDTVFVTQYVEDTNSNEVICISYQQLMDIMAALKSPEGAFYARFIERE